MPGGRRRKPVHMYEATGNYDMVSKARLQELKDGYITIGESKFQPPDNLEGNLVALEKWREIMLLYKESPVQIITSADIGLLERYCMTYYEYTQLLEVKREINEMAVSPMMALLMANELKLDDKVNKKNTLLLRMDSELFLTPLSKSRAIPQKQKPKPGESKLKGKGFGDL